MNTRKFSGKLLVERSHSVPKRPTESSHSFASDKIFLGIHTHAPHEYRNYRIVLRLGNWLDQLSSAVPILTMSSTKQFSDSTGDQPELVTTLAQHHNNKKPRMTEGRFRLAFEKAPIGMAVVDFDYSLRRVNQALCEALGYTANELLGRSIVEISHADDVERATSLVDKLIRGEIPSYRIEKRFVKKDGALAWLDVTAGDDSR